MTFIDYKLRNFDLENQISKILSLKPKKKSSEKRNFDQKLTSIDFFALKLRNFDLEQRNFELKTPKKLHDDQKLTVIDK